MNTFDLLKKELLDIINELQALFGKAEVYPEISSGVFEGWKETCSGISKHVEEDIIRIAVVGTIKSGKSTFINSCLNGDYLKRGAGVVTSLVTRARFGDSLSASIQFKTWDEVNADMENALVLLPAFKFSSEKQAFDIRRSQDRDELERALSTLGTDQLISNDTRNINSVYLFSYLKGFERVKEMVGPDTQSVCFKDDDFKRHMEFVGDEDLAVYVRDIELEINTASFDQGVEIADCQGSDSPNPIHLVQVQDYLLNTHLIIYVISSRTGLRQADIRFLTIIRNMGIMENVLFVVNSDLNEHESVHDLKRLTGKVAEELSLISSSSDIYTFSGLYNLFVSNEGNLNEKDRLRLEQWKNDTELTAFSNDQTDLFEKKLSRKISEERYSLLLKNQIERLNLIANGLANWAMLNKDLLLRDAVSSDEIIENISRHQEKMTQVRKLIKNTLDGAASKLTGEIKQRTDSFFDERYGDIAKETIAFIRGYRVSFENYEEVFQVSGFAGALYKAYQDFKQALDVFLAEVISPKTIKFINEEENRIESFFETVSKPYEAMIQDALDDYRDTMNSFGVALNQEGSRGIDIPSVELVKNLSGLKLPPTVSLIQYSARVKTEAVMRFGFYRAVDFVRKLMKKTVSKEKSGEVQALRDGIRRLKRDTEASVVFHFRSYKENVKFQYFVNLVNAYTESHNDALSDRFQAYVADLETISGLISEKHDNKEKTAEHLTEIEGSAQKVKERVDELRSRVESSL